MQDKDLFEILKSISDVEYITSDQLSEMQQIGVRTIRKRIKLLNQLLEDEGAYIQSKPRYGYQLIINNHEKYHEFIHSQESLGDAIPTSRDDRIQYLLAFFLKENVYIKMDTLVENLYISKSTLSADLKQVEQIVEYFGLTIERRPNYGTKILGSEFNIRKCMSKYQLYNVAQIFYSVEDYNSELKEISKTIIQIASQYKMQFSELALDQFVKAIFVQISRIKSESFIHSVHFDLPDLSENERLFLSILILELQNKYSVILNEKEKKYLRLHFSGKRMIGTKTALDSSSNFVIQPFVNDLVNNMIKSVYENKSIDFRDNLELKIALSQHMVPLDIRIRYGLFLENVMLQIIKEKYIMGYNIATQAATVINEYYKIHLVEDEIGLLALIFALPLEQLASKKTKRKFRILIVCNSGKAMSKLLMHQFNHEFKEYIESIDVSDVFSLNTFDFTTIDYLFTTVPIKYHVPVPIQEISVFLEASEQVAIRAFLEGKIVNKILDVYRRSHFLTNIMGTDRETVLLNICNKVNQLINIDDGLYESVMNREKLSATDFGNYVAIPHPDKIWSDKTYVFTCILDKEIMWYRHKVKVVFLIMMGAKEEEQQKEFYEITTKLVTNKDAIRKLIDEPEYETLAKCLIR